MVYVARFTDNIDNDIQRGWSGWMGHSYASPAEWAIDIGFAEQIAELENADSIDEVSNDDIVYHAEKIANTDLRFDDYLKSWRVCHHDGLSCWILDAETETDAITEAAAKAERKEIEWAGFGQTTVGTIKVVKQINDNLYVLECEDYENEA